MLTLTEGRLCTFEEEEGEVSRSVVDVEEGKVKGARGVGEGEGEGVEEVILLEVGGLASIVTPVVGRAGVNTVGLLLRIPGEI